MDPEAKEKCVPLNTDIKISPYILNQMEKVNKIIQSKHMTTYQAPLLPNLFAQQCLPP